MKRVSLRGWFVLLVQLSVISGCDQSQSTDGSASSLDHVHEARYTCEAVYPGESRIEIRSADQLEEACALAVRDCDAKISPSGRGCLAKRWYDQRTTADGMTSGQGWACEVAEHTSVPGGRSWVRPGATLQQARENALIQCEQRKAGNNCQIIKCFDASNSIWL